MIVLISSNYIENHTSILLFCIPVWEAEYDGLSINKFLDRVTDAFTAYCVSDNRTVFA